MAKLIRPTETKIFGSTALAAELTPFGSSVPSTDINLILNSTEAQRGWGTIGANGFPPMEWFNALGYGLSYYNAYLMQQGIPEWTALQNYYINSYTIGSDGKLYRSKTGIDGTPNAGNTPVGDTVNWSAPISDTATSIHDAIAENPGDTDEFGYWDSFTQTLRKVTLANFKATLKTYFDTVYAVLNSPVFTGTPTAPTATVGTNTTQLATTAYTRAEIPNMLNASGNAPMYACRAWVNFNGTNTVAIRASGNVSSITDGGSGIYTVNFTTAMADANYGCAFGNGQNSAVQYCLVNFMSKTTTNTLINTPNLAAGLVDVADVNVAIFR